MSSRVHACGGDTVVTAWCSPQCACEHIRPSLRRVSTPQLCVCSSQHWGGKKVLFFTARSAERRLRFATKIINTCHPLSFSFFFGVNHKPRKWSYKDDIRSAGHRDGLNGAVWVCNMASGPAKQLHTAGGQFIPGTVREEREEIHASSHRAGIKEGRERWHMGALGGDMNRCPALPPEWSTVHSYCLSLR